jgi:anaerobic selenocysteine-containing dehydrogenase
MPLYSTACPRNCYSTCSFKVHVEDNKVVNIDPHPGNLATPEGICLKGLAYIERANSPDRILYPLIKNKQTGKFEKASWEETFRLLAEKINYFQENFGKHSILFYASSGMAGLVNGFSSNFWKMIGGATTMYGNLCWPAGLEATQLTLGDNKHNVPWDLENAKLIIFWGKNAAETNIQEMIPVDKALEKGATVVVIDPRRTQTSEKASLLIQPKPGTDGALALAVGKIIVEKKEYDKDFVDKYVLGFERFTESLTALRLSDLSEICGVDEIYIHQLANLIAKIKPMTIIPGYGMQRFANGGQTIRCILSLSVITGNIGKKGACWHYANLQSYVFDTIKEPMSYYPPEKPDGIFRRSISMAKLGEDMIAAKDPELKMIWVERGNPVPQNPDTNTIIKAFRNLKFRVVVDQFMTDTAIEADVILPAKNMFEQSDIIGSYWNPYIQLKPKVVEPAGEVKPETEIYYYLAKQMGFPDDEILKYLPAPGNDAIEEFLKKELQKFPELDYEKLKEGPQIANSHEEIAFADMKFDTPSGKIELFSEQASKKWSVDPLPTYVAPDIDEFTKAKYPLNFLSPNTKNRIHSQFNNLNIIKLFSPGPFVEMHPLDAQIRNIRDGGMVKVYNDNGYFRLKVKFNYSIKRKCVAISNGWWIHQGGSTNFLSKGRETDMGYGAAFHDTMVEVIKDSQLEI